MVKYIYIILYFLSALHAQSIIQFTDDKGTPVPYVVIQISDTQWFVSDEYGKFYSSITSSPQDSIKISRFGYKTEYMNFSEITGNFTIILEKIIFEQSNVIVAGNRRDPLVQARSTILPNIQKSGSQDLRRYFSKVSGVTLKSYGGPGSISTLSIDGGTATNTKVLIDGFDLTNTQNGEMDLSQLPLPFIQKAKYESFSTSSVGSGTGDGIFSLSPWWNTTGASISVGSYGHHSISGNVLLKESKRNFRIMSGKRYDRGDFPVSWRDQRINRENNSFDQEFAAIQYNQLYSDRTFIKFLSLYSNNTRGVPGTVWAPSNSTRKDQLLFSGLTIGKSHLNGMSNLKLLAKYSFDEFDDNWFNIHSDHESRSYSGEYNFSRELSHANAFGVSTKIQNDRLNSSDAGKISRWQIGQGLFLRSTLPYELVPVISIDLNWANDSSPVLTWKGQLLKNIGIYSLKNISMIYSTGFRRPTFNELFWQPGGNPDLLPEKNTAFILSSELSEESIFSGNISVFYRKSENLIQWVPYISFWRPVNISESIRWGTKVTAELKLPGTGLYSNLSFSKIITENLGRGTNNGKPLRYAPKSTGYLLLGWDNAKWSINGDMLYTGKVLSIYDWPEDQYLPENLIFNMSLSYLYRKNIGNMRFTFTVQNINNKSYESMLGYPEMGRNFRSTIQWELE